MSVENVIQSPYVILTSFASCLKASSYSPLAAYSRPRFLYSFDLIALEHSGVFNTVHWAWAKYSSACSKRPKPAIKLRKCEATFPMNAHNSKRTTCIYLNILLIYSYEAYTVFVNYTNSEQTA